MHSDISVRVAKALFWNSDVNKTVSSEIMYMYSTNEGVICSRSCMSCFAHLRVLHHCTVHCK